MPAHSVPRISPEEYLALDRAAEYKSEYHGGEVFAMSGGTLAHAQIGSNFTASLFAALRDRTCIVCSGDVRIRAPQGSYVYPDGVVVCGMPQFAPEGPRDTITNPTLVVEVLAESSEVSFEKRT